MEGYSSRTRVSRLSSFLDLRFTGNHLRWPRTTKMSFSSLNMYMINRAITIMYITFPFLIPCCWFHDWHNLLFWSVKYEIASHCLDAAVLVRQVRPRWWLVDHALDYARNGHPFFFFLTRNNFSWYFGREVVVVMFEGKFIRSQNSIFAWSRLSLPIATNHGWDQIRSLKNYISSDDADHYWLRLTCIMGRCYVNVWFRSVWVTILQFLHRRPCLFVGLFLCLL